jgi:hypothetical protein
MINEDEIKKICEVCGKEKFISNFTINHKTKYRRKICKHCVAQGLKMSNAPVLKTKVCRACGLEKDIKHFHKAKNVSDGYIARCKKCKTDGNLIPKEKKEKIEFRPLTLAAPSQEDYVEMYLTLKKMGYNLSSDLHIQFCERYGLKANNPKQIFKHHISQKDLGLI